MKPVEQLTNEELRIEIAEFCGWTYIQDLSQPNYFWAKHPSGMTESAGASTGKYAILRHCPNYPSSLDAMWEAEQKLIYPVALWDNYLSSLGQVCNVEFVHTLVHAPAKQRAIAFVKTIREIKR